MNDERLLYRPTEAAELLSLSRARLYQLLAQGERVNRDNPDMRFWIGFYYINKFGSSDEKNTLRSLLQLSGIDPAKRDPNQLRTTDASGRRRNTTCGEVSFE